MLPNRLTETRSSDDLKTIDDKSMTGTLCTSLDNSVNNDDGNIGSVSNASSIDQQLHLEQKMNDLFLTLEPFVHKLDEHVSAVRASQELLNQELNTLLKIIHQIKLQETLPKLTPSPTPTGTPTDHQATTAAGNARTCDDISADLEDKSRRLLGLKRRLTLVHSILQTVNSRTKKLLLAHNSRIATIIAPHRP